jgi:hypothetical protein
MVLSATLRKEKKMNKATNNNTTTKAITAGVAYVESIEKASARLWAFGEAIAQAVENGERGVQKAIATAVASETGRKVSTMVVEVSRALKCYRTYDSAESASSWTLNEVSGRSSATASVFDADKWAKGFAAKRTKTEIRKAIAALQAQI